MARGLHGYRKVFVYERSSDRSAPSSGNQLRVTGKASSGNHLRVTGTTSSSGFGRYRPGDVIAGKYELIRVISQGGMGFIWVAQHLTLQIETAIKLIRPDLCTDAATERFINEARVAACVEHPAIVSIFDLGVTERGDPFMVMELLRGEDLRELLKLRGRLSPVEAVQLMLPIADALATAHARGIVHRDLKPENVFLVDLDKRVFPKLVDFGIAKPGWACERRLTRSGMVMGSPEYMSPEQALGVEDSDQRVDVWAFCIVLYECLVGRPPFSGNHESTLNEVIEKPVVPITELGILEPALWTILQKGLAKQRERRFDDIYSLGRALAQWLLERGVDEDVCAHSLRATWLRSRTTLGRDSRRNVARALPGAASARDSGGGAARLGLHEAVTLRIPPPTPAAWGVSVGTSGANKRRQRFPESTRVLAFALALFGIGCAGGSVWLGSALALPRPPAVSGTLVLPARTAYEKFLSTRGRRAPRQMTSASATAAPPPGHAGMRSQVRGQAPRRATPPTDLLFGF